MITHDRNPALESLAGFRVPGVGLAGWNRCLPSSVTQDAHRHARDAFAYISQDLPVGRKGRHRPGPLEDFGQKLAHLSFNVTSLVAESSPGGFPHASGLLDNTSRRR